MSYTFQEALDIVEKEPVVIRDGIRMVQVVVPFTEKYFNEFTCDLLVKKYRLRSEDSISYAKDGKFSVHQYSQQIMNDIFKSF